MPELHILFRETLLKDKDTHTIDNKRQVYVFAQCDVQSINAKLRKEAYAFTLKLPTNKKRDLDWYLEEYMLQPVGGSISWANDVVKKILRSWEEKLLIETLGSESSTIRSCIKKVWFC